MSKISDIFKKKKALITFITAGDPSLAATEKLVYQLEEAGADIIELGIPFSDPLADGPVIQASHQRALRNNTALSDVFNLVSKVRKKIQLPICFMLSYNLLLQYGRKRFYRDCERKKVDGVIVPDLPPEEGVAGIGFVAPTSSDERIKLTVGKASGFIYLISVTGITGKRKGISGDLENVVNRIRKFTKLPIAIGFGISNPAQAKAAARLADGIIVGSAIVDLIAKRKFRSVSTFVASLRRAIDSA